jgi:hypothetical protein
MFRISLNCQKIGPHGLPMASLTLEADVNNADSLKANGVNLVTLGSHIRGRSEHSITAHCANEPAALS